MRIGVCIPCYSGHVNYLKNCLKSIEDQTRKPDIVSISISGTNILCEFPIFSFPLKITITENKQCAGKNRNVSASKLHDIDILRFVDADDILHPKSLEYIEKYFNEPIDILLHNNKQIFLSFCRDKEISKIQWDTMEDNLYIDKFHCHKDSICGRVTTEHGETTNGHLSCRKSIWNKNQYLENYGLGEDSEYVYRLYKKGYNLGFTKNNLSYYLRNNLITEENDFTKYTSDYRPHVYSSYTNTEINNIIDYLLSEFSPEREYPIIFNINPKDRITKKIFYNIEQMTRESELNMTISRLKNPDIIEVWDYSSVNCEILKKEGLNVRHVPFKLSINKIIEYSNYKKINKLYDIAFSGQYSEYRLKILDELEKKGKKIFKCNDYSEGRDIGIGKSKLLINIHYNETYKVFESVRCEPWLASGFPVLSESSIEDDPRCTTVPYNMLVDKACKILDSL
jgi:hypothetical protein